MKVKTLQIEDDTGTKFLIPGDIYQAKVLRRNIMSNYQTAQFAENADTGTDKPYTALDNLDRELDRLEKLVGLLRDRLTPVTIEFFNEISDNNVPNTLNVPNSVPIPAPRSMLMGRVRHLENCCHDIDAIINRLDI